MFRELLLLVYICFYLVLIEAWHRSSLTGTFTWLIENPYVFFLNFIIFSSIIYVVIFITGRQRLSVWMMTSVILLLFTISRIKMNLKGEPLLPWDVFLGNEAANIKEYFVLMSLLEVAILFGIVVITILIPFCFEKRRFQLKRRVFYGAIPFIVFFLLYFEKPVSLLEIGDVNNVFWDQSITYQRNGVHVGFVNTLQLIKITPPEGYSKQKINELVAQLEPEPLDDILNPNIIIIMNEAFWDPTRLSEVTFNEDPLPFFRSLKTKHTNGELIVPVFGGSTANTEFEILTGNSMHFLPQGSIPYSQYVHSPQPTIASILRNKGYKAIAIHNYHNWFYRRDQVYKHFGFDHFISQNFFENPEFRRSFISDLEMSRKIIDEYEKCSSPLFVFAVTMQNHGPYNARHYDEDRITVSGEINDDMEKILNTYSTGVKDADDALKLLVQYFEVNKEPTIIVFFGDHLPYLGAAYRGYTETNFISDANPKQWSKEEFEKMYSVPFLVWDNFSETKHQDLRMSSSFLVPFLLENYKVGQYPLMAYLNTIDKTVFSNREDTNELSEVEMHRYHLLQYDQLFGEEYALPYIDRENIEAEHFQLGTDPLLVSKAVIINTEKPVIEVVGENFTYKTTILLNGKELPTTFHSNSKLIGDISSIHLKNRNNNIQVIIKDSKNRQLSNSNILEL